MPDRRRPGRCRVVFLIRSLNTGGTERQLVQLVSSLDRSLFDLTVLTFYAGGPVWNELSTDPGIVLEALMKRGRWDLLSFLRRLTATLKRVEPDILHCLLVEPSVLGLFAGRLARVPAVVWGVRASNVDFSQYDTATALSFKLAAALSRFPDLVIANSEAGRRFHIARGYSPDRFRVIRNGIPSDAYIPSADLRRRTRERWRISDDAIVVGNVARLDPMKGHGVLLRAARQLATKHSRMLIMLVGAGSPQCVQGVRALIEELDLASTVMWVGEQPSAADIYPAFDVACSASLWGEGFSNAVAEAMSCGVPCVVTDVGDSAQIVGDTGAVVSPDDATALANALDRMIDLIREGGSELSRRARQRIVERFSVRAMVDETMAAYAQLAPACGLPVGEP
jgi:glycosyltransferase involved in cell wall biosynthesis